jgi:uncharacterized glyoxalase superfamily protein PhnB
MTETSTTETSTTTGPAPAPQVWPTLQAVDALALIDFYVDTFGFRRTAVYADGDTVAHAQLDWPEGGGIMLGSHKPDAEWSTQPGTLAAYAVTDHIEELWQRVEHAPGVTVIRPLTSTDYGSREFAVRDPEGNAWSFGTYRGEPSS